MLLQLVAPGHVSWATRVEPGGRGGRGGFISRGGGIGHRGRLVGLGLWVHGGALVFHICDVAVDMVSGVGDSLDTAVGKMDGVRSSHDSGFGGLLGVEDGLAVVVSDGIGVLIGVSLLLVGGGRGVGWRGGAIGRRGIGEHGGHQGCRCKESKHGCEAEGELWRTTDSLF